jgi:hypothetical protein
MRLSSSVALVEELCVSIRVCVRRATNSCTYPIPSARDSGDPKAESYLGREWVIVIFQEG